MIQNKDCWLKNKCNHKDCDKFCIRLFKLDSLYDNALIPLNQRYHIDLVLDSNGTDRDAFTALKDIELNIESFISKGNNLYLHSTQTGNVKTSWAIRLIQTYFNNIWHKTNLECKALFIHVPTFLLSLKDNISVKNDYIEHIKKNVFDCDVVIWDEIGTKSTTQFEAENLLSIIDARLNRGKSNIYTSNLNGEELQEKIGDRLYSRIVNLSADIEFKSFDKRGLI
jgi:DNA replication protein DnaC